MEVKDLVKALRNRLEWTQEQVAERSAGALSRVVVNKIESGRNQATSAAIRNGLAMAFGVDVATMFGYLEGEVDLTEVMARRAGRSDDREFRYPNRETAIMRNAQRWRHATVLELRAIRLHKDGDLPTEEWSKKGNEIEAMQKGKAVAPQVLEGDDDTPPAAKRPRKRRR